MSDLIDRLKTYRSLDGEWGDKTHHTICDEAADRIYALEDVLEETLFWLEGWLLPKNIGFWDEDQYEAAQHTAKRARQVFSGQTEQEEEIK